MALPSIILPEYRIKLLTKDEEIVIRPLTVREEKILLMAAESNSSKEIIYAVRQIITNCIKSDINIDNLDFFELIYIYLHIRKISAGEEIRSKVTDEDGNVYEAICNLNNDIDVTDLDKLREFDEPIQITGNSIFVELKPMKFKDYIKLISMYNIDNNEKIEKHKVDFLYTSILLTINKIYTNEESYDPKDYSLEELRNFYESFPQNDKLKIQEKFNNLPKISLRYHYKDKNGNERERKLEKVDFNFFG